MILFCCSDIEEAIDALPSLGVVDLVDALDIFESLECFEPSETLLLALDSFGDPAETTEEELAQPM